jgi:hypothetical protein
METKMKTKTMVRAGTVLSAVAVLALGVAIPGVSSADKLEEVFVANTDAQPVPVTGRVAVTGVPDVNVANTPTVEIGNTPSVIVTNPVAVQAPEPFQYTFASSTCAAIHVPAGRAVMIENLTLEVSSGTDPEPKVRLMINGAFGANGELFEAHPGVWGGFWDMDLILDTSIGSLTEAEVCPLGDATFWAIATGHFVCRRRHPRRRPGARARRPVRRPRRAPGGGRGGAARG